MAFVNSPLYSSFCGQANIFSSKCIAPSRQPTSSRRIRRISIPFQMCSSNQSESEIPDVLQKILERKKIEVDSLKDDVSKQGGDHPLTKIMSKKGKIERSKNFYNALNLPKGSITVIAEVKRKSPSKGHIGYITNPGNLSRIYHAGGAGAISVLTDYEGFGGTIEDLKQVKKSQDIFKGDYPGPCPILRKEFIIDEIQIVEAVEAGASAILLIIAALGKERTEELLNITHDYGLDALVEVHNENELQMAIDIGADIIGVNNRNLKTFEVSLDNSFNLVDKIPDGVVKIAESGINDCKDVWKLRDAGFNAVLVGETLVTAAESSNDSSNSYTVGYNKAVGFIKAYCAKGSVEFGNSAGAASYGRGEGAKETLGELAM